MRFVFAVAATLGLALPAAAESVDVPSGTYVIDPSHSSVVWKVSHMGFSTYTGMFDRSAIDATIELDAADVTKSTLNVTLGGQDVVTLHPGPDDFDAEIASDMFLNAVEHPEITFTTTSIAVTGENTAEITGELTMNGTTLPVTLDTTLVRAANHPMSGKPHLGISAIGTIDRTAFGIQSLAGPIGTDVTVEIQAEFGLDG
ncbi:YceI family protein [Acuticoccus kandeliae]|uniref:YceI family protein n=1 Tax=Acuticoccus kandeliae TaxID=2073160 RepID=UPI000D3E1DB2|nr:YceI family protein [Acuticoccus kandeliae]